MHTAVAESEKRRKETKNSKDVQDYISKKDEGPLSWLWGRRVLLIGDSIDRFMIEYFCQEMGYKFSYPQVHKNSICEIPSFNMTLVHWHLAGTPTYKAKWWWDSPMKIVPFEERWEKEWAPTLSTHVRGLDGRKPDLVMWQIGQWDKHNLFSMAESHFNESDFMRKDERPLVWQEIRFLAARYKKFISLIHNEFGSDVPAMFRALTADRSTDKSEMQLFEMDRLERAVAEWSGLEIFEWGRILTAFTGVYRDMRHVGKGPGSWLWGNMVLEYLARSAGVGDESRAPYFNGWQACHDELNHGGGR